MKIYNMKQQTPEWFEIKKGKFSASEAQAIATNGKGLDTLILEKVAKMFSKSRPEAYTNADLERGNELEQFARGNYELTTGQEVTEVGFVELDEYVGCSPDGLVGDDGLIEIKCPKDTVYINYVLDGKVETKYMWQMQMQMYVTGRKWCDYVVYNENFSMTMGVKRVDRDEEKIEKLKIGLKRGIKDYKRLTEGVRSKLIEG